MTTPAKYTGSTLTTWAKTKREAEVLAEQYREDGADISEIRPERDRLTAKKCGKYVVIGRFFAKE
jgi:hypothetical protein